MSNKLFFEYRKAFKLLDENDLGRISLSDFSSVVALIGVKIPENDIDVIVRSMLGYHDNMNRSIKCMDFPQFLSALAVTVRNCVSDDEIQRIFQVFDKDGDGFISPQELKALLLRLGDDVTEKEIQEMMLEADLDGDGLVNLSEFSQVISTKPLSTTIDDNNDYGVTVDSICTELSKLTKKYKRTQPSSSNQSPNSMISITSGSNPDSRCSCSEKEITNSKKKSHVGSKRRKSVIQWFKFKQL